MLDQKDAVLLKQHTLQLVTALAVRNTIENGKRREPADTRKLEDANTMIQDAVRKLQAMAQGGL